MSVAYVDAAPASLLEVRGLSKSFGGVAAVDAVDFTLDKGALRCIIGPNGAGKSTFFKLLMGNIPADSGRIMFAGRDITRMHPFQRAHLGIGVKVQNLGIYQTLSVRHNLFVPLQHHVPRSKMAGEIDQLLTRLNLAGTESLIAGALSHGQKQWLAIGMALAMKPVLLLLDEPTAGMGTEETLATGELIQAVNREGVTIIVVEHDMAFVRQLEAPITVLHYGRVFAEGSLAEIESHEEVRRIYLGTTQRERKRIRRKQQRQ